MEGTPPPGNADQLTHPGIGMCTNCWLSEAAPGFEFCAKCVTEAIQRQKQSKANPDPKKEREKFNKNKEIINKINKAIEKSKLTDEEQQFILEIIPEEIRQDGTEILETLRGYKMSSNLKNKSRKIEQLIAGLLHLLYGYKTPAVLITGKKWYAAKILKTKLEEKSLEIQSNHKNNVNFLTSSLSMMEKLLESCPDVQRTENNRESDICSRINDTYMKLGKKRANCDEDESEEDLEDPVDDEYFNDQETVPEEMDEGVLMRRSDPVSGESEPPITDSASEDEIVINAAKKTTLYEVPVSRGQPNTNHMVHADSHAGTEAGNSIAQPRVPEFIMAISEKGDNFSSSLRDENCGSSQDAESTQIPNSSRKGNFFSVFTEKKNDPNNTTSSDISRSTVTTPERVNKGSPHHSQMAKEGVELRPIMSTLQIQSSTVSNNKIEINQKNVDTDQQKVIAEAYVNNEMTENLTGEGLVIYQAPCIIQTDSHDGMEAENTTEQPLVPEIILASSQKDAESPQKRKFLAVFGDNKFNNTTSSDKSRSILTTTEQQVPPPQLMAARKIIKRPSLLSTSPASSPSTSLVKPTPQAAAPPHSSVAAQPPVLPVQPAASHPASVLAPIGSRPSHNKPASNILVSTANQPRLLPNRRVKEAHAFKFGGTHGQVETTEFGKTENSFVKDELKLNQERMRTCGVGGMEYSQNDLESEICSEICSCHGSKKSNNAEFVEKLNIVIEEVIASKHSAIPEELLPSTKKKARVHYPKKANKKNIKVLHPKNSQLSATTTEIDDSSITLKSNQGEITQQTINTPSTKRRVTSQASDSTVGPNLPVAKLPTPPSSSSPIITEPRLKRRKNGTSVVTDEGAQKTERSTRGRPRRETNIETPSKLVIKDTMLPPLKFVGELETSEINDLGM